MSYRRVCASHSREYRSFFLSLRPVPRYSLATAAAIRILTAYLKKVWDPKSNLEFICFKKLIAVIGQGSVVMALAYVYSKQVEIGNF